MEHEREIASVQDSTHRAAASNLRLKRLIAAKAVREMCGGISDMSLWRWLNDPELGFPRPIYIQKRRFWREADLLAWLDNREVSA